jgi:hypothetical protein
MASEQPKDKNMKQDDNKTDDLDIEASRLVMCKWWQSHDFGKWIDIAEKINKQHHPVLIQERRCLKCNVAERRYETIT